MGKSYRIAEIQRLLQELNRLDQEQAKYHKKLAILADPYPEKPKDNLSGRAWDGIDTLGLPDKLLYILKNNSIEAFGMRIEKIWHILDLQEESCDWHRLEGFNKRLADILTEMMQFAGFKNFHIKW